MAGVPTAWETVLKSCTVRKVENHCKWTENLGDGCIALVCRDLHIPRQTYNLSPQHPHISKEIRKQKWVKENGSMYSLVKLPACGNFTVYRKPWDKKTKWCVNWAVRDNVLGPFLGEGHSPCLPLFSAWRVSYDLILRHVLMWPMLALNSLGSWRWPDIPVSTSHTRITGVSQDVWIIQLQEWNPGPYARLASTLTEHTRLYIFIGYDLQRPFLIQE